MICVTGRAIAVPTYTVQPLPFGGMAYSVNSNGDIAGFAGVFGGDIARIRIGGINHDISPFAGDSDCFAYALNDSGVAIGGSRSGTNNYHERSFEYANGIETPLGALSGGTYSTAEGINQAGQICGWSESANGHRAFLWQQGSMQDLGVLPGDVASEAFGINDEGDVVGNSISATGQSTPVVFSNGKITPIPGLSGGTLLTGAKINDLGWVVGTFQPDAGSASSAYPTAYLSDGVHTTSLGSITSNSVTMPTGLNNKGQVVGWSLDSNSATYTGWIYTDGATYELKDLADSSANNRTLSQIFGIQDSGAVYGYDNLRSFIATPVPEPTSLLLILGGIGVFARRGAKTAQRRR